MARAALAAAALLAAGLAVGSAGAATPTRGGTVVDLAVDEQLRARVLHAADAKLARDVPEIPLYTLPLTVAHRSNIRNIVPHGSDPHWNAGSWRLARP